MVAFDSKVEIFRFLLNADWIICVRRVSPNVKLSQRRAGYLKYTVKLDHENRIFTNWPGTLNIFTGVRIFFLLWGPENKRTRSRNHCDAKLAHYSRHNHRRTSH